jgi:hypothetical protein
LYLYTCVVFLWLIPHPTVIWLIYGSKECNKYVCMYVCTENEHDSCVRRKQLPQSHNLLTFHRCFVCSNIAVHFQARFHRLILSFYLLFSLSSRLFSNVSAQISMPYFNFPTFKQQRERERETGVQCYRKMFCISTSMTQDNKIWIRTYATLELSLTWKSQKCHRHTIFQCNAKFVFLYKLIVMDVPFSVSPGWFGTPPLMLNFEITIVFIILTFFFCHFSPSFISFPNFVNYGNLFRKMVENLILLNTALFRTFTANSSFVIDHLKYRCKRFTLAICEKLCGNGGTKTHVSERKLISSSYLNACYHFWLQLLMYATCTASHKDSVSQISVQHSQWFDNMAEKSSTTWPEKYRHHGCQLFWPW